MTYVGPRRTGRRRAEQGAPLAAVQSSYQVGFRFLWDTLVAEAHQTGIVSDAELVDIASDVWMLNTLFTTELADRLPGCPDRAAPLPGPGAVGAGRGAA